MTGGLDLVERAAAKQKNPNIFSGFLVLPPRSLLEECDGSCCTFYVLLCPRDTLSLQQACFFA